MILKRDLQTLQEDFRLLRLPVRSSVTCGLRAGKEDGTGQKTADSNQSASIYPTHFLFAV
jgi:hypothetical protein